MLRERAMDMYNSMARSYIDKFMYCSTKKVFYRQRSTVYEVEYKI